MQLENATINFLGDSITEGFGISNVENRYTDVIEREFHLKKANNYGECGTRIARQQVVTDDPFDRDFCMRLFEMDKNADAVVVFGGTNDFGHGTAPLGVPSDRNPDTFYGACHFMMNNLLTIYCGKPIAIITPLHRIGEDNPRGDAPKAHSVAKLDTYRKIIMEVAEYYGFPVLDLYSVSGMQPANPLCKEQLMPDGLHPNDAGHGKIARIIGNFLLQL